jgi:basic membrane lipoprotein Med (substrate-binding protein (PBP1-ABC) superfamily)
MLALYRSGRHAEALEVYERLRVSLDDDLGLQPSADLQRLSGQIVRQDPELRRPSSPASGRSRHGEPTARRVSFFALAGAVVAAMTLTANGGAASPQRAAPMPKRLALVLSGPSDGSSLGAKSLKAEIRDVEILYKLESQTLFLGDDPTADVGGVMRRIRASGSGLVVAVGDGPAARALAGIVPALPETRFLFIDASLRELSLEGVPNAAAIRFAEEDVLYLAGYMSGLVPTMDGAQRRIDKVAVVAAEPSADTARLVAGFRRGLRDTNPRVRVRVAHSHELDDVTACERLANREIDDGSDVVIAIAGRCGLGAAEVARIRGVWAIGSEEDGIRSSHLLMAMHKEWSMVGQWALDKLVDGTLAMGRDTVLGLEDDYATGLWFSLKLPAHVESAVIRRCSEIRASRHRDLD